MKRISTYILLLLLNVVYLDALTATEQVKPRVMFLVSEDADNYDAHKTIPAFAELCEREHGLATTVLQGSGELNAFRFPNLEALRDADLLVIFVRRCALPRSR